MGLVGGCLGFGGVWWVVVVCFGLVCGVFVGEFVAIFGVVVLVVVGFVVLWWFVVLVTSILIIFITYVGWWV